MFEERRKRNRAASANVNFVAAPYEPIVIYRSMDFNKREIKLDSVDVARVEE